MDAPSYAYPKLLPPGIHLVELVSITRSENPFTLSRNVVDFIFRNEKQEYAWRTTNHRLKDRTSLHRTLCELSGKTILATGPIDLENLVGQIFEVRTALRTSWGINIVSIRPAMHKRRRITKLPASSSPPIQ
jgi:hypothetical protein